MADLMVDDAQNQAALPADRRASTRVRAGVAALLFLLSLLTWAFATPPESSPDDDFHIANIYCLHDASSCRSDDAAWPPGPVTWPPDPAARTGEPWDSLREVYADIWPYEGPRKLPCFNVTELEGRLRFVQRTPDPADCLNAEDPGDNTPATVDSVGYYPQVAYRLFSVFTQDTIRKSVAAWRIVACLLVLGMAAASFRTAPRRWRQPLLLGWLLCGVPYGVFLFASHNPSGLAMAAAFMIVGPALGLLEDRRLGMLTLVRGILVGAGAVVAVGSRAEGLFWVMGSAVVIPLLASPLRISRRAGLVLAGSFAAVVIVAVASGLFADPVRRLLDSYLYGTQRASLWQAVNEAPYVFFYFNEPLGWLDVPIPESVVVLMSVALFGSIVLGLARFDRRKALAVAVAVAAPMVADSLITLYSSELVQARYFLPMIFLAVVALLAPTSGKAMLPWSQAQWVAVGGALALTNAVALSAATLRYVTGINSASPLDLRDTPQWWWQAWLGPLPNLVVGSVAFAAALLVTLPLCRQWNAQSQQMLATAAVSPSSPGSPAPPEQVRQEPGEEPTARPEGVGASGSQPRTV
jgi:hypothetical protein